MDILFLSEDDVKHLLELDGLLDALADGFKALTSGQVCAPPRNEVIDALKKIEASSLG
jgi:ornithine cyclodeaminase/alanine dehydrogenase-like protein (mu-crystallin family)